MAQVESVVRFVCSQPKVKIHKVKNRFDMRYNAAESLGYRDCMIQLSFNDLKDTLFSGYVFELQVHLSCMLAIKSDEGHKRYIAYRNLTGG